MSEIDPPAASLAVTRSVTRAPGGAVNAARNWPAPWLVTVAGCQCAPPSKDTAAVAPVTADARDNWRCPAVKLRTCGPAGAMPRSPRPCTWYSRVIIGCTAHRWVATISFWPLERKQIQEAGTRAAGSRWDRQVHTVRLAGDSW